MVFSQWAQWPVLRFLPLRGTMGFAAQTLLRVIGEPAAHGASRRLANSPRPPEASECVANLAAPAPKAHHCVPQKSVIDAKAIVPIVKKPLCPLWLKKTAPRVRLKRSK